MTIHFFFSEFDLQKKVVNDEKDIYRNNSLNLIITLSSPKLLFHFSKSDKYELDSIILGQYNDSIYVISRTNPGIKENKTTFFIATKDYTLLKVKKESKANTLLGDLGLFEGYGLEYHFRIEKNNYHLTYSEVFVRISSVVENEKIQQIRKGRLVIKDKGDEQEIKKYPNSLEPHGDLFLQLSGY